MKTTRRHLPWTRAGLIELLANVALVVSVPLLIRLSYASLISPMRALGFGSLMDALGGNGGFTDIGTEVAATWGLVDGDHSTYEPTVDLDHFANLGAYGSAVHPHPPTSMAMWIPLVWLDYPWWLSFWVAASFSMVALTFRVMGVSRSLAYPLALAVCVTPPGISALWTTYPLSSLALALAWTYRGRAWISGISLGLLAANRGIALILLAYPVARRNWKTLAVALLLLLSLSLVAVAFEPSVFAEFVTTGREELNRQLARSDLLTAQAIAFRRGLPSWPIWGMAALVVLAGILLKRELFWLLVWFTFAVTPVAWAYTPIATIPLLVVMWRSGPLGKSLTVLIASATLAVMPASPLAGNFGWTIVVALSGIAVIACPLGAASVTSEVGSSSEKGRTPAGGAATPA